MTERSFRAGDVFFRPGDPSEAAFLLQSGQVEILRGEARLARLGPGDLFGEMALVEERPHALTARATADGTATALTREEFERDLLQEPARCRAYLRGLFERLRQLSARISEEPPPPPTTSITYRVTMHPLTRKAAETLPEDGLPVPVFPFRVGRAAEAAERDALDLNDLWLLDDKPFHVSRNHMLLEIDDGGHVAVIDRGSQLGTIVNETPIGGRSRVHAARLHEGDNVVVLGGPKSPYQFRIAVERT